MIKLGDLKENKRFMINYPIAKAHRSFIVLSKTSKYLKAWKGKVPKGNVDDYVFVYNTHNNTIHLLHKSSLVIPINDGIAVNEHTPFEKLSEETMIGLHREAWLWQAENTTIKKLKSINPYINYYGRAPDQLCWLCEISKRRCKEKDIDYSHHCSLCPADWSNSGKYCAVQNSYYKTWQSSDSLVEIHKLATLIAKVPMK